MNKAKKNIVIVGFTKTERNSIAIPSLEEPYYESQRVHYVDNLSDATKYQGYMLIIDNKDNKTIVELDKKYRGTFNKYEIIMVYNKNYVYSYKNTNKWSRLEKVGQELFEFDAFSIGEKWDEYKKNKDNEILKTIKFNKNKEKKLNMLYQYLKKNKTRKTNEISKDLNINNRSIQRYMHDLNEIYHNIGYDYSLNEWYIAGS